MTALNAIGPLPLDGRAGLAPMAGVTDAAFRSICRDMGAAWTVSEMLSVKAIEYGDKKTFALADLSRDQGPVFLQLFGREPREFANAVRKLIPLRPAGFDVNMGCPVPKVAGNGAGSALMKEPARCGAIVAAMKEASEGLPVTVKIRAGWDKHSINAVEVALRCAQAGADAVCVHGRTREQQYSGPADWGVIRQVKEALTGTGVAVIGNGDVTDAQSAARMLAETGCDLAAPARGALGNPWIFREINAYLRESCTILPPPGVAERILVIRRHIGLLCEEKGENRGMREARKHLGWYVKGLRGAAEFRRRASELCKLEELDRLLGELYAANRDSENEELEIRN